MCWELCLKEEFDTVIPILLGNVGIAICYESKRKYLNEIIEFMLEFHNRKMLNKVYNNRIGMDEN